MNKSLVPVVLLALFASHSHATADDQHLIKFLLETGRVAPEGQGNAEVAVAFRMLVERGDPHEAVTGSLLEMRRASPRKLNWLRAVVDTFCERAARSGDDELAKSLEGFVKARLQAPRARNLAFEWLVKLRPEARARLIPGMLDDPSVELRREAVAHRYAQAEEAEKAGKKDTALAGYREVLNAARDEDQIEQVAEKLRVLGEKVDIPAHYGFLMTWQLVGPFDNTAKKGFAQVFAPENGVQIGADYSGKGGEAKWLEHTTPDEMGVVDLNKVLGKEKSVVYYAVHEFKSDEERDVELRLSTPNAWKLWLNGEFLNSREEYHRGTKLDHYTESGRLKKGNNVILLKVCQNDQAEAWAQKYNFRMRVCDATGAGIPRGK